MEPKENLNNDAKIRALSGLIFECPLGSVTHNCPFIALWRLPIEERFDLVEHWSSRQVERLLFEHKLCLSKRDIFQKVHHHVKENMPKYSII